jgi:pyruvate-formate lyase-activating enzyme
VQALILTVTRACNLRCSYCPTVKDGWPSLTPEDATRAVDLFAERYGGGDIKLFGGEPLLVPDVVRAAFEAAERRPEIRRISLSTNGLGLDREWLARVAANPKAVLTLSIDGAPEDHRRLRRALPQIADAYDHLHGMLPAILATPRVVVTQTIAPSTAARAAENFAHLRALGFTRFNLLPGYYLPWQPEQLAALDRGFAAIADAIRGAWRDGRSLYLRNLFTWAPTPFFNTGLVVDADRTIHPSNVGLSRLFDELRGKTQVGTLDDPPSRDTLARAATETNALLAATLEPHVWQSTLAVDAALTRLCDSLYADFAAYRKTKRQRAA